MLMRTGCLMLCLALGVVVVFVEFGGTTNSFVPRLTRMTGSSGRGEQDEELRTTLLFPFSRAGQNRSSTTNNMKQSYHVVHTERRMLGVRSKAAGIVRKDSAGMSRGTAAAIEFCFSLSEETHAPIIVRSHAARMFL